MYLVFQLRTHSNLFDVEHQSEGDDEEAEVAIMGPYAAAGVLVVVTIAVAVCAEYLVDSIDSLVETAHISKTFVGLILLPIVGNAAEHVTAIVVAVKDKMDLAMGVAIGSSMQIALLVTPSLVILGWVIDQPMTLHFEIFETVVFFVSVLVVTYVIQGNILHIKVDTLLIQNRRKEQLPRRSNAPRSLHHYCACLPGIPR